MAASHCAGALSSQHCEQSSLLFPEQSESLSPPPRSVLQSSLRLCQESARRTPEAWQRLDSHQWSSILFSRTPLFRARARRSTSEQPSAPVRRKARAELCPTTAAKPDIPLGGRAPAEPVARPLNADQYPADVQMLRAPPAA